MTKSNLPNHSTSLNLLQTVPVTVMQKSMIIFAHFLITALFHPTVFFNSASVTTDLEKANLFNSFFHSVYNPCQSGTLPLPSSEPIVSYPSIANISFTELEVFSALSSLDPAKSMGVDCIGSKLLKQCASALYIPLHHLFSLSIFNHAIPSEWKHHSITPIFKSGERTSVNN